MATKFATIAYVDKLALNKIQHFLTGHNWLGNDLRRLLVDIGEAGESRVSSRAPRGTTLQLANSISHVVDQGPVPTFVKITADATNRRDGERYGWMLQASKRIVYLFARGPRAGRPTRRWFTGALPFLRKRLREGTAQLSRRIEGRWRQ